MGEYTRSFPSHLSWLAPCFSNWAPQGTGAPCIDGRGTSRSPSTIAGLFLPRLYNGVWIVFICQKELFHSSQQNHNSHAGPCSLVTQQLGMGEGFILCLRGSVLLLVGGGAIPCDLSEPNALSTLQICQHKSRSFILLTQFSQASSCGTFFFKSLARAQCDKSEGHG